jgi:hypothetical protein
MFSLIYGVIECQLVQMSKTATTRISVVLARIQLILREGVVRTQWRPTTPGYNLQLCQTATYGGRRCAGMHWVRTIQLMRAECQYFLRAFLSTAYRFHCHL